MNRRSHLILVALIVAGLLGVAVMAIPASPVNDKPTLGLDLQGGLEVTLQAVPPANRPLQKSDLDRSVTILRDRVDRLGVAEPEIRKQGDDQIVIDLPGVKNPDRVIGILGQTAQLELFDLEANLAPPSNSGGYPAPKESLYSLLAGQQSLVDEDAKTNWYLFDDKKKVRAGPVQQRDKLLESKTVADAGKRGELPKGWRIFGVPPKTVVVSCGVGEVVCPGANVENPTKNYYYLLKYDPSNADPDKVVPEMTGADLKLDGTRQDFDTTSGQPIVTMQFTDKGGDKFGEITNREADRGRARTTSPAARATRRTRSSTSRSCSTARSSPGPRSTSSSTRTGSAARTAPRSPGSARSARRRTWRSCSRAAPCPSPSRRSRRPRSRRRSARTRSPRPGRRRSRA